MGGRKRDGNIPWPGRCFALAALLVLAMCGGLRADDGSGIGMSGLDDAVRKVAQLAREAVRRQQTDALKKLAPTDSPLTWLVVDELLGTGDADVAKAYAQAGSPKGTEPLVQYASRWKASPQEAARRALLVQFGEIEKRGDWKALLAAAGDLKLSRDVLSVRLALFVVIAATGVKETKAGGRVALEAAGIAEEIGFVSFAANLWFAAGTSQHMSGDDKAALASFERMVGAARKTNAKDLVKALWSKGVLLAKVQRQAEARAALEEALAVGRRDGNRVLLIEPLHALATIAFDTGQPDEARAHLQEALGVLEGSRDPHVPDLLRGLATVEIASAQWKEARAHLDDALERSRGNVVLTIGILESLGEVSLGEKDPAKADESFAKAYELAKQGRDRALVARTLSRRAFASVRRGALDEALPRYQEALAIAREVGDPPLLAGILGEMGGVEVGRGNLVQGRLRCEEGLAYARRSPEPAQQMPILQNLALIEAFGLRFAAALRRGEEGLAIARRLQRPRERFSILSTLVQVEKATGRLEQAQAHLEEMMPLARTIGTAQDVAAISLASAITLGARGRTDEANARLAEALEAARPLGPLAEAAVLAAQASVANDAGHVLASTALYAKALEKARASGANADVTALLFQAALARAKEEDLKPAEALFAEVLDRGRRGGSRLVVGGAKAGLAVVHWRQGNAQEALTDAKEACRTALEMASGLADEQSGFAKDYFDVAFSAGALAATDLHDPKEAAWFLEAGRAGALLEGLSLREHLADLAVPAPLVAAEAEARAREAEAAKTMRAADANGNRAAAQEASSRLRSAQEALRDARDRIDREAKAAANVVQPVPASLEELEALVRPDEALLLYDVIDVDKGSVCLVVVPKASRLVRLAPMAAIRKAADQLLADDLQGLDGPARKELAELLIEPLGLSPQIRRLLVSPDDALGYVPFALLAPDRDVAYVPSGTTLGILAKDRDKRGEQVLALGDPDVGKDQDASAVAVHTRGSPLGRLERAREEAKAVGNRVLIGAQATEAGFREAVAGRPRWRSVHFACHGLLDAQRPTLSALALAPQGDDDGFLTAHDVFRLRIPSDLVVLSGCETARGKVYHTEGVVGLTRAFMYAGSPRVICSLWNVDDEATMVLMKRFYALWNASGPDRIGPAAALRRAMEYVRDFERTESGGSGPARKVRPWAHPRYWAAWTLWGLPD